MKKRGVFSIAKNVGYHSAFYEIYNIVVCRIVYDACVILFMCYLYNKMDMFF